jgi:hypothetical protein
LGAGFRDEPGEAGEVGEGEVSWTSRVAPAEADFAAEVGAAYASGGKARQELWPRASVQPGAFGPGTLGAYLPVFLRAVADAGGALLALLGSSYLSNGLAIGSLMVALRAGRSSRTEGKPPGAAGTGPPPVPEGHAVVAAFEALRDRLVSAGFRPDQASQIALELLEELLTDPADATVFVRALSAVPGDTARSASSSERPKGRHSRDGGGQ